MPFTCSPLPARALRPLTFAPKLRRLNAPAPNFFLVVENDANDAFLIRRALATASNAASFVCRNFSEARSYLLGAGMYADRARFPFPNLVLTDLQMETESGLDLITWLRSQPSPLGDVAVIMLTGSASPDRVAEASATGARVHQKPARLEDLITLMREIAREFSEARPFSRA